MTTQYKAILLAFQELGGLRTISEIEEQVQKRWGNKWKDLSTVMADMVSPEHGGNQSSNVPNEYRVLKRVARGEYTLLFNRFEEE